MTRYIIVAAAAFAFGWLTNGWRLNAQIADMRLDLENKSETLRLAAQFKINRIDSASVAKRQKQAKVDQSILDKVETNVPTTLPLLPGSFRVHHDAAAAGEEIDDTRRADAAPVAPKAVAVTTAENYASSNYDKQRLAALQEMVKASGCFDVEE